MTYPIDADFEEYKITKVFDGENHWCVYSTSSMITFPKVEGATPKEGSVLRTYPRSFGRQVRGVFIDGQKVYYRTEAEEKERHQQWLAKREQKQREEAEANAAEADARIAKLPQPFQDRIQGFRKRKPDFRWKFEEYELYCCEQAAVFAQAFPTPEAIEKFAKAKSDAQLQMLPSLDQEHSGNTFGASVQFARLFVAGNYDFLFKAHGAMCPLVGCDDYGCYASSPEAAAERQAEGEEQ